MKLSILDQAPILSGLKASDALKEALNLAKLGEELGYTRYWIAEHHNLSGLSSSAPEIMLSYIGANTKKIRIGSGAILLPHYKPYKVAEVFNTLAILFPNRIDLGIGRAPGGSAEATNALSDNFLEQVWKMPATLKELLEFLDTNDLERKESRVIATPLPDQAPKPWLLGTSKKSALLAAEYGMSYAFGHFMSDYDGVEIIKQYKKHFTPIKEGDKAEPLITVSVICADTTREAEELALYNYAWKKMNESLDINVTTTTKDPSKMIETFNRERTLEKLKRNTVIGNQTEVASELQGLKRMYDVEELMIVTIPSTYQERTRSYQLLAEALL
ncbi:LLM class flavin-dependent oxidoreductase [Halalkalibacter krulwichiae]|uniref:2,5-diketocamphane 1,2-monooxygenase n=1 Tax=Halalkalibacter krulwichiae TaxID=199441 RepID=A0A1X9MGB1_9BACI|nr:LLM class flavin-dependent oxidoreductase [Halalkalibacter krulwichiae]ARK30551.1 2,5-diketocamphane 1,2-monooxygenase [Halalkalibacter krulwichiae]